MVELFNRAFTRAYFTFRNREEGQAMVEYALILGLVSVVAIGTLATIGQDVNNIFDTIETHLADALTP